jgi:FG-GAP repeat protein/thrombospondin type 3 repeat protein
MLAVAALASPLAGWGAIVEQAYLKDPDPRASDYFGWSTAISGDTLVVGAPYDFGDGSGFARGGAAYVFVRNGTTWTLQAYLESSNAESNDWFGYSVAISGDTIVVGAISESSSATGVNGDQADNSAHNAGAAYVFVRNGTTWTQQAYLKASNTDRAFPGAFDVGDLFGYSVGVSGDTVVVGTPYEESNARGVNGSPNDNSARASGAVWVFVRSGTNWSQEAYLKASNAEEGDFFGYSVAVSGDTVVVGARREDSAARGVNGNQSNNSMPEAGAAYVFVRTGTNWSQQAYLKASNTDANAWFGWSVAASGDTVVVGALQEGSIAMGSGAAYVFARSGTTWTQQAHLKASNADRDAHFGVSVAVSGDTVVVGAPWESSIVSSRGAAYVFVRSGTSWSQQAYLKSSNGSWYNVFGYSVGVSGDTVAVGDPNEDTDTTTDSGAAYVFAGLGPPPPDSDGDGVPDNLDQCPGTAPGAIVDAQGCSAQQRDSDNDGVPDSRDQCPDTPVGAITDANGCSIEQLVPCDGSWRNHGEYLGALREAISSFLTQGLLKREQAMKILKSGIHSDCGMK